MLEEVVVVLHVRAASSCCLVLHVLERLHARAIRGQRAVAHRDARAHVRERVEELKGAVEGGVAVAESAHLE